MTRRQTIQRRDWVDYVDAGWKIADILLRAVTLWLAATQAPIILQIVMKIVR